MQKLLIALSVFLLGACVHLDASQRSRADARRLDCQPTRPLIGDLAATSKGMIVGEMHGTNESRLAVLELICAALDDGKTVSLALEMPDAAVGRDSTRALRDEFWKPVRADGRSSKAMLAMIEDLAPLRRSGSVKVYGFADPTAGATQWEERSARNILAGARPGDILIVLTGNVHARRSSAAVTIGSILAEATTVSVLSREPGAVWACMPACGEHPVGATAALSVGPHKAPKTFGYDYAIVVQRYSPSAPALGEPTSPQRGN
jgi:hypothetical protein